MELYPPYPLTVTSRLENRAFSCCIPRRGGGRWPEDQAITTAQPVHTKQVQHLQCGGKSRNARTLQACSMATQHCQRLSRQQKPLQTLRTTKPNLAVDFPQDSDRKDVSFMIARLEAIFQLRSQSHIDRSQLPARS